MKKIKETNFYNWHAAFKRTLGSGKIQRGMAELGDHLKENFGTRSVNEAIVKIGVNAKIMRDRGLLKVTAVGIVGNTGTTIKDHSFHGKR